MHVHAATRWDSIGAGSRCICICICICRCRCRSRARVGRIVCCFPRFQCKGAPCIESCSSRLGVCARCAGDEDGHGFSLALEHRKRHATERDGVPRRQRRERSAAVQKPLGKRLHLQVPARDDERREVPDVLASCVFQGRQAADVGDVQLDVVSGAARRARQAAAQR